MSKRDKLAIALLALGLLQMAGYLTGSRALRGLGAATVASPLPIVFSDVKGLETFASEFTLKVSRVAQISEHIPVTPELYAKFGGPYNRRNVYGAAISYGPRLPEPLWRSVLGYGFCANGPLAKGLGLGEGLREVTVEIETKTEGRVGIWNLDVSCNG